MAQTYPGHFEDGLNSTKSIPNNIGVWIRYLPSSQKLETG